MTAVQRARTKAIADIVRMAGGDTQESHILEAAAGAVTGEPRKKGRTPTPSSPPNRGYGTPPPCVTTAMTITT